MDAAVFVPLEPNRPGDKSAKKQKIACCIFGGPFSHPATDSGIAKIRLRLAAAAAVPFWDGLIEMPRLKYCLCFSRSRSGCGSSSPTITRSTTDRRTTWRRPRRQRAAATASWGTGASRSGGGDSGPRSSESSNTVREGGREKVTGEGETQNLFNESSVNHELLMRKMMCGVFLCSPCT